MKTPLLLLAAAASATLTATPAAAQYGGRTLSATLTARAEVPGPGKLDARGWATVTVNPGLTRACYNVRFRNIPNPTMAHVHRGAAGVAGPPVVTLTRAGPNRYQGCARISRALGRELVRMPRRFYVNVHSRAFPDGAIRGQLRR